MSQHHDTCICHACMGLTRPIIAARVTRQYRLQQALVHIAETVQYCDNQDTVNALLNTQENITQELNILVAASVSHGQARDTTYADRQ